MKMKQIIVTIDESGTGTEIKKTLTSLGYDAAIVSSGNKTIETVKESKPDILIIDIMLHGDIDGIEAGKLIREELDIPVIFLNTQTEKSTPESVKKMIPYGYIEKPFRKNELYSAIETALYRHGVEKELKKSEKMYRAIIENADEAVIVVQDETIKFANPKMVELLGFSGKGALHISFFDFVHPDDREMIAKNYIKRLKGEKFEQVYTFRIIDNSGNPKWVDINATQFSWDGKPATLNFLTDVTERKKAEKKIKASLEEKEILLREVHHRVKNNMQVISSILSLQENRIKNEELLNIFKISQDRIRAMSLIHEKLYQSDDLSRIELSEYINTMASELFQTYMYDAGKVAMQVKAEEINLGIDQAIPCGLIINELISNAIKHAFPPGSSEKGKIMISASQNGSNEIQLTVEDDGVGIPEDFDIKKINSLGLELVQTLAEGQLNGTLKVNRKKKGSKFFVSFKNLLH